MSPRSLSRLPACLGTDVPQELHAWLASAKCLERLASRLARAGARARAKQVLAVISKTQQLYADWAAADLAACDAKEAGRRAREAAADAHAEEAIEKITAVMREASARWIPTATALRCT